MALKTPAELASTIAWARHERNMSGVFEVINRGYLWMERITPAQQQELREWYHAWLDITDPAWIQDDKFKLPTKPAWLV